MYSSLCFQACMSMSLGLPEEMYCKADPQCMGVECCLTVKLFMYKKNYKFYTRYDPCATELVVGIDQLYETRIGPALDMDDIFGGWLLLSNVSFLKLCFIYLIIFLLYLHLIWVISSEAGIRTL